MTPPGWAAPVRGEPVVELAAAEPDESADLVVRDAVLGDEAPHVAFGDVEPVDDLVTGVAALTLGDQRFVLTAVPVLSIAASLTLARIAPHVATAISSRVRQHRVPAQPS